MTYFTENDLVTTIAKQTTFGGVPAVAYVLPIAKSAQGPEHSRNKIENDARYADGYNREPALGNHRSGADLPLVSNLDIVGYPLYGFCGTMTTTGASAPYTRTGKPGKTVIYYVIEEGLAGAKYYQYVDQVFSEANVEYDQEVLFKPTFKTVGSVLLIPASAGRSVHRRERSGNHSGVCVRRHRPHRLQTEWRRITHRSTDGRWRGRRALEQKRPSSEQPPSRDSSVSGAQPAAHELAWRTPCRKAAGRVAATCGETYTS